MAAIVSDTRTGLAEIRGIHGGGGRLLWKRLAAGNMMFTDVDSFEVAVMPPGASAGRHVHTRTEELFLVLDGRARIGLGDQHVEVAAGDAILTGFMGEQSVEAIGDGDYRMLVVEALPPQIVAALPAHRPAEDAGA